MKNKSVKERISLYMSRKTEAGRVHYLRLTKRPSFIVVQKIRLRLERYRISSRSAETAFYLLLALVPFLIFLISLFGLLSESIPFRTDVFLVLQDIMPAPVFSFISNILSEIIASRNVTFLSISMLGFIWASSKGFSVILQGLNRIYSTKKSVNPILLRILGLVFALLLVLALMVSVILITFGDMLFQQIAVWSGQTAFSGTFLHIIRYVVSFTFLFLVFSLLHYLASHRKGGYFRAMPGAAFTASCWILFSFAVSWYVNNFGQFSKLYGSLTGIIVLMVWLYFCCLTILTGAIIHELILERHISRKISGDLP